jgi:membrane-associated protease RseP (regulator of RpoE activity)
MNPPANVEHRESSDHAASADSARGSASQRAGRPPSSGRYQRARNELAAGGSGRQADDDDRAEPLSSVIGITAWIALFVWLWVLNAWFVVFVVGVLISVFLHEVGHYCTARKSGMKVTMFFIGFGPRVWSFRHANGIEYGLRMIPLGAFVRIIGMNNLDDDIDPADEARTFRSATFPRKMWTITAGSVMHMFIAIVLITIVYSTAGRAEESGRLNILGVTPGSAAGSAGFKAGDEVLTVNGERVATNSRWRELLAGAKPGTSLDVTVRRDGAPVDLRVVTIPRPDDPDVGFIGVTSDSLVDVRQSLPQAVGYGAADLTTGVGQAIVGVAKVINPVNVWGHLAGTNDNLDSRPTTLVGATRVSDDVAEFAGWAGVLALLASLNVSVGVFNMFPLLPLDGGHAAIATYERVRSRRGRRHTADVAKLMPVLAVTIAVLAFMFFVGLYLDIVDPVQ